VTWCGATLAWWAPLDRDARHRFGPTLRHEYGYGKLTYYVDRLEVIGDPEPVDVEIRFYAEPSYDTYGLPPQDFPRVHAKSGASSKHRYGWDDALCLWQPDDPADERWTSDKGLLDLIEIIRRYLFLENYWRDTGGHHGGEWILEEAPHGLSRGGGTAWRSPRPPKEVGRRRRPRSSSSR
jgi:hypothetical protein